MAAAMIKTIRRNAKTYSLKLAGANTYGDDGFATEAVTAASDIKAHIQPAGAKELRNLPEGQNTLQWIVIWSESNVPEKAEITYGGVAFTIQKVEYWDDGGFYKSMAVKATD